ncbi:MAG: hypothetical protein ACRDQA_22610 [Nocardioidaceae bacterium]
MGDDQLVILDGSDHVEEIAVRAAPTQNTPGWPRLVMIGWPIVVAMTWRALLGAMPCLDRAACVDFTHTSRLWHTIVEHGAGGAGQRDPPMPAP